MAPKKKFVPALQKKPAGRPAGKAAVPERNEPEEVDDEDEEAQDDEEEEEEPVPEPQGNRGRGRGRSQPPSATSPATSQQSPSARRVGGRHGYEDSPSAVAARVMHVSTGTGGNTARRASVSTVALVPKAPRLKVDYGCPEGADAPAPLGPSLVKLRSAGRLCDAVVVAGGGRMPVHRVVLAAHSDALDGRLQGAGAELDLGGVSHEAADILVRWLYGEVSDPSYSPSTAKVNEELLQIASELALKGLSELCALRMAADADTSNIVSRVRLCEEFGLPRLRAALVAALVEDSVALDTVARDAATLGHPALMRELLAAIAVRASAPEEDEERDQKRARLS
mmetsp:Transcript_122498/g.261380  ORF Transcript_122498/g.261380 Transcript_122498/m.261380 type:complete len:339 (+) Transcript_122498:82-1098(+)